MARPLSIITELTHSSHVDTSDCWRTNIKKLLLISNAASIHTKRWSEALAKEFTVAVFSLSASDNEQNWYGSRGIQLIAGQTIKLTDIRSKNNFSKLVYLKSIKRLYATVRKLDPDIVHAHYASSYGLLAALLFRKSTIVSVWGSDVFEFPRRSWLSKQVLSFVLWKAAKVCATSQALRTEAEKYTRRKDIRLVPFGIDTELFRSSQAKRCDSHTTIVIQKPVEEIYGHKLVFDALKHLESTNPELAKRLRLVVIGSGTALPNFKRYVESIGLTCVTFTGYIQNNELPAHLSTADFAVFPSIVHESFGVAALEAQSCDLPVIVSNLGGLPEVVENGVTGIVLESLSAEDLADKIALLAENRTLRDSMSAKARAFVCRKYSIQKSVDDMMSVYSEVCS